MSKESLNGGVYLFVGPDRLRKQERLARLVRTLRVHPLDRHVRTAREVSAPQLGTLIREYPALSSFRLIIIEDAHRLSQDCVSLLEAHHKTLAQVACVVLLSDTPFGVAHPLLALKPYATVESFEERDRSKPSSGFALAEAIARRDVAAALGTVHEQLAQGKDVVELFGLVGWQLQRWLTVSHLRDAGLSAERIAEATGWSGWQVEQVRREVAGRRPDEVRRLTQRCWEADVAVKTGRVIPRLALEQVVVELCVPSAGTA